MHCDADPGAQLNEAVQATLFTHHPYGMPIIGWGHEIEGLEARGRARLLPALLHAGERHPGRRRRRRARGGARARRGDTTARSSRAAQPPRAHSPARAADGRAPAGHGQRREGRAAELAALLSRALLPHRARRANRRRSTCSRHLLGGGQTSLLYRTLVLDEKIAVSAWAYYMGRRSTRRRFFVYVMPAPDVCAGGARRGGRPACWRSSCADGRRRGRVGARQDAARRRRHLRAGQPGDAGALVRLVARDRPDHRGRPAMAGAHRGGRAPRR